MRLNVRLRPTRFGFLVSPGDTATLRQVFETNTCLWGGKYNPVIPVFKRRPPWWDRGTHSGDTPDQIVNGYLNYFEPDVLIETRPGLADGLGFHSDRVITLDALCGRTNTQSVHAEREYGLRMGCVYRELHESTFQFSRRDPQRIVRIEAAAPEHAAMAACVFGGFSNTDFGAHLQRVFDKVFAPDVLTLDADSSSSILESNWMNPLHVTHEGLRIRYGHHGDPRVFVFDGTKPGDLIDFWNLRAGVAPVVPVPIQFAEQLAPFVRRFISSNHRPLPGNQNGVMIRPVTMFGRSMTKDTVGELLHDHFRVDPPGTNTIQTWYPSIWRSSPDIVVSPTRPEVTAKESSHSVVAQGDRPMIEFDGLEPDFVGLPFGQARWANAVTFPFGGTEEPFATIYPDDFRDPKVPAFTGGRGGVLSTGEGFVVLAVHGTSKHFWSLEDGAAAIRRWLATRGIKSSLSGSGRATQQLIQTLGGFRGMSALASERIVHLLNEISRRPTNRSMEHNQFRNRINLATRDSIWNTNAFQTLVDRNAVEIGLEVRCDKCGSWSWYALGELGMLLKCQLCLRTFGFPSVNPADAKHAYWAYRLIGAFAQPNYAQGGYAAALSMRLFAELLGDVGDNRLTWCAGQELNFENGHSLEADFILWFRRAGTYGTQQTTHLVFGEAKSFGRDTFTVQDVARMQELALKFPGAAIAFATMRSASDLTAEEIGRLKVLAEWGRRQGSKRGRSRTPIVVLTGTELFAEFSLRDTWKKAGGRHAELVSPAYVRTDNLLDLADMTQQLYLGMEPYDTQILRRIDRVALRRKP